MSSSWPIWLTGIIVLVVAGIVVSFMPRLRARRYADEMAWVRARAAIAGASASRDAVAHHVAEAEALLSRAESVAAEHGGSTAARTAQEYAERADRLWRASDETGAGR